MFHDLRYAARGLSRNPAFTALVAGILALGIGANSAVFSIVNAVLLRPLPYHEPDRLYRVEELNPKGDATGVSPSDMIAFEKASRAFEKTCASRWQNVTLTGPEGAENVYGGRLSRDCFSTYGRQAALGRVFRDDDFQAAAPDVIVLADRLFQRRFAGNPAVVGKTLIVAGQPHTIIGVMPADFFLEQRFEFWTPWRWNAEETSERASRFSGIVRLKNGVTADQASNELQHVLNNVAPEDVKKGWRIRLTLLSEQMAARARGALMVALGAVAFVLLIACMNAANLLLTRASGRSRELSVRVALGAGRWRLVRQLLAESMILAVIGGLGGLLIGVWGAQGLVAMSPDRNPVPRLAQTRLDAQVLLFTFTLTILTALIFGLIPALQATRGSLNEALKEGGRTGGAGVRSRKLRSTLVVLETALSVVLLVGAGLMLRSFERLMKVNPGFDPEQTLAMRVPMPPTITDRAQQPRYYERLIERLQKLPGVNSAGLIAPLPLADVDANGTFAREGRPGPAGERQLVKFRVASPGYFRAMGIPVLKGRVFGDADGAESPGVVVVNEALARKFFPNEDPVGKLVTGNSNGTGPFMTVIGVVRDVRFMQLGAATEPEMYRDYRQNFFAPFAMTLVLRSNSGDPLLLASAAQKVVREINPDQPVSDLRSMRQVISANVAQPRFQTVLLSIFATIALLLAAAGLYGVLSHSVAQRVQEIGIRMALGAPRGMVFRMVLIDAMTLAATGVVLGLLGAFALTRLIAAQLYQTEATDPLTFLGAPMVLLAVAAAAACLPARRALGVDPVVALRCD